MRLLIAAVGRLKQGAERDLAARYLKRAAEVGRGLGFRPIEVLEIRESRNSDADKRAVEESIALANMIPERAAVAVLDRHGQNLDSEALVACLANWRDGGRPAAVFLIGGADGLSQGLQENAELSLAFGAVTWPHQLVRIMLLEQIYRSMSILAGHPYHRG